MLKIITKQLSSILPEEHKLKKHISIDPTNFSKMFSLFKHKTGNNLCVYDVTVSKSLKNNQIVMIKDHINNTGVNILIGRQKKLNIDFTDMTNIYSHNKNGVITICIGERVNIEMEYPSKHLCHITTLARAMQFKTITGFLYNNIK